MKRSSFDVPAENECRECEGQGVTRYTAPELERVGQEFVTVKQGSGCPDCLGTGRL